MRVLKSIEGRLFLIAWIVYSAFFATNVVREHYPAFALIEHGSTRCDDYLGWHDDIFRYKDGHSYINNNLMASAIAAVPLLLWKPVLDALQAYSLRKLEAEHGDVDTHYDTKYPDRQALFQRAKLAGKDLYFGAATAITSALLMAPVTALCVVLMFGFLRKRRVGERKASMLSLLFAFGTPVFFRAASLNHNTLLMAAAFGAFLCLYEQPDAPYAPSVRRRACAGLLLGLVVALDYAGFVTAAVLGGYFVALRTKQAGLRRAVLDCGAVAAGTLPGLAFLLGSQWLQFGNPFLPAQFVMKPAQYTGEGLRGIGAPSIEIFLKNLLAPGWGMYVYSPLLLLGLVPAGARPDTELVVARRERRMFVVLIGTFLVFCSMNRYSLVQYNTGFRYLAVLVPFVFLQACDALLRMRRPVVQIVGALAVAHMLILCMARDATETERHLQDAAQAQGVAEYELPGYAHAMLTQTPVPLDYERVLWTQGPQLPWLTVLSQTSSVPILKGPLVPSVLLMLVAGVCIGIWRLGARLARAEASARASAPAVLERRSGQVIVATWALGGPAAELEPGDHDADPARQETQSAKRCDRS